MKIIETHAHLDFPQLFDRIPEIIDRGKCAGINKIISIGCDALRAKKTSQICKKFSSIFGAVGIHPNDCGDNFSENIKKIEKIATENKKIVAIGETGLDFFYSKNPPKKQQVLAFREHIKLAKKLKKPLILHFRNAENLAAEILPELKGQKFVVHCFSGDQNFAKKIFNLGGKISFTGIITFPNCQPEVIEVLQSASPENFFFETDSPFLAPQKFRGKINEPSFLLEIIKFAAKIRNEKVEELAIKSTKAAELFFNI